MSVVLFRYFRCFGPFMSPLFKVPQKEAIVESAVENAHFQRNARGFWKRRHLCGCKDHRALTVGEKNSDRMDFLDANRLRVDNGRNPSVLP